jgi:hypothetical protein
VAACGCALLAACSGSSHHEPDQPATLTARSAASFLDSVGVNVHLGYGNTAYRDTPGILDRLSQLGVHHVRDALPLQPNALQLQGLRALPARGIKADLAIAQTPRRVHQLPSPLDVMNSLVDTGPKVRAAVEAVEAPNEWDLQGGDNWVSQIVTFTRSFGSLLRSDPVWGHVTYVGPSTGRVERVSQLPNLGAGPGHVDVANLHNYTAGGPPERDAGYLAAARRTAVGKPLWVTEIGFHTAVEQVGRQPAVTEAQQGSYVTRQLLENYSRGVARSYIYELAEEKPDPALIDQEQHFGLLRTDLSPKPAFTQLRTLLDGVRDPAHPRKGGAASADVPELKLSIRTPGDPVGSLLLRRTDGSYRLVLWARGGLALDGASTARNARVDVVLTGGARAVSVQRTAGGAVAGSASGGGAHAAEQIAGRLGGDPVILDIGADVGAGQARAGASPEPLTFDTSGLPAGAETAPHGKVGHQPDRVKTVLIAVLSFVIGALAVTMCVWTIRRQRRRRRSRA